MMHNHTSHTATGQAPKASHPAWARIADDLTEIAPLLAGRDDLTVIVAPGAAGPAPGRFGLHDKVIELDADLCFTGLDPATVTLTDLYDHHRYPCALGVFAHECAHAAHTRWRPDHSWPGPVVGAAFMLEDLRIEAAQIARRPLDRLWLRSASLKLDVPDLRQSVPRALGLWRAAAAAAVCLGRVDAGILSSTDSGIDTARTAFQDALGKALYEELETIWRQALTVADTDAASMHALGAAWCQRLTAPATVLAAASDERQQQLAEATHLAAESLADAALSLLFVGGSAGVQSSEPPPSDLFAYTPPPKRTRPPTGTEKATAARLARALTDAARRPRTTTAVDAETPPGRLNMRGALAGAAQRAAGAPVTAKPWKRTVRKRTPDPAARIGIALDVSASMDTFFAPATAAAWMLARAAKRTGGNAAAATFGERARTLIPPGKVPAGIPQPGLEFSTDHLNVVIDALDTALGLGTPDQHARLLFMITDGGLTGSQLRPVADQCERLVQAGCAVIQIGPEHSWGLEACRTVEVADPVASLTLITQTATTALRAAVRRSR